jgi:hypothetical protein
MVSGAMNSGAIERHSNRRSSFVAPRVARAILVVSLAWMIGFGCANGGTTGQDTESSGASGASGALAQGGASGSAFSTGSSTGSVSTDSVSGSPFASGSPSGAATGTFSGASGASTPDAEDSGMPEEAGPGVDAAGNCANTQTDPNNCGSCGKVCAPGATCSGGVCGFSVGGTLIGLSANDQVQLQSPGLQTTTLSTNGRFTLSSQLAAGTSYSVSATVPAGAPIPETCTVQNASGTANAAVTGLAVNCVPTDYAYFFPFTGNSKDASGNHNDGVITGGVTLTADPSGNPNSAYHFDGTTGYITAPGGSLPLNASSRTLTAWIEPLTTLKNWGIVSWGTGDCTAHMFGVGTQATGATTLWEGCNDYITNFLLPASTWSFVAIVFSSAAPMQYTVYVNDQSASVQLSMAPATSAAPLLMGFNMSGDTAAAKYFSGDLDSIRVYARDLSASEISAIFMARGP